MPTRRDRTIALLAGLLRQRSMTPALRALAALLCAVLAHACATRSPRASAPPAHTTPLHVERSGHALRAPEPFHRVTLHDLEAERGRSHLDHFHLQVTTRNGREAEMRFVSSYGRCTVDVIPALPGGEALLCLVTGRGRGTSVRAETLAVFRLDDSGWNRVAWLPISWYDFVDGEIRFHRYRWTLTDRDGDGTAEIHIQADPLSEALRDPVTYRWDPAAARFTGPPGAPPADRTPAAMGRDLGWVLGVDGWQPGWVGRSSAGRQGGGD